MGDWVRLQIRKSLNRSNKGHKERNGVKTHKISEIDPAYVWNVGEESQFRQYKIKLYSFNEIWKYYTFIFKFAFPFISFLYYHSYYYLKILNKFIHYLRTNL